MRWLGVLGMVVALGCSSGAVTPDDGGAGSVDPDSGPPDSGPPAKVDGGLPDAGIDAGPARDAGPAVDAGTDAGTVSDAGTDAGTVTDGGTTDGGVDAGPVVRWPGPRTGYVNPIPVENQKAGDPRWNSGCNKPRNHEIEGYADRVSASAGETVRLMIRSDSARTASWTLYRLGWYGGAGARALLSGSTQVSSQPACNKDMSTGLLSCAWAPTLSFNVPSNAVSGLYLVRIVRSDNFGVFIPLVVKDQRQADLYLQSSVTTAQAYNNWGGEGLYDSDDPGRGFAVAVSFDRPYASDNGSGQVLRYEALMANFLERNGYDVSYTTNLDVAREGAQALFTRGAFLSVGHDEYWPTEERTAVQSARDQGVPLYFFGGNEAYWKVRLSNPGVDGNARVMTCYKRNPPADPLYNTPAQTGRYRDPPINNPEEALSGVMYESWMLFGQPWTVVNSAHPMYAGTGLHDGDTLSQLVGYEYDRPFAGLTPGPATVLGHSPLIDAEGKPGYSESVLYTAPSGALVFGAGTIYWAHDLDGPQRDARVERMTANLLQLGLKLPIPDALKTVSAPAGPLPDPFWATSVGTIATGMPGPAGITQLPDGSFVIADSRAHRIWRADTAGNVTAYAGDGNPDGTPRFDNLPGLQVRFFQPTGVLADAAGNVYVSDTHNCSIRKIANDSAHTVTTIAGVLMSCGLVDGAGAKARLDEPMGLAWLDATHLVIADMNNQAIRTLDLATSTVSTLAVTHWGDDADGPAASATFYFPTAVTVAPDGRIFFLASSTGKVKVIGTDPARTITSIVAGGLGFSDGPGSSAQIQAQAGLLWNAGTLLLSDSANQRLRLITPGSTADTTRVQTWAGSGQMGMTDGTGRAASFEVPLGLTRGRDGLIYLVDGGAGSLRVVRP